MGLFAARDLKAGEQVLSVPKSLWMSVETAGQSPAVGAHVQGLRPWVALALHLLDERSKGDDSRWAPYIRSLPQEGELASPMFWPDEDLALLQGTQLLSSAMGYRQYITREWQGLREGLFDQQPGVFDAEVFSEEAFAWAFGILRSRVLPPCEGDSIALVPGMDMLNHGAASSEGWESGSGGIFGSGGSVMRAKSGQDYMPDQEVMLNYGQDKIDAQLALDFGFVPKGGTPGYILTLAVPEADRNADDKIDIAELAGLGAMPSFSLLASDTVDPTLHTFIRLLNLQGSDCFLLEALFRDRCWELISEPVSEENERMVCESMLTGCQEALNAYPTTVKEDEALLRETPLGSRAYVAIQARLGEKRALAQTRNYFEDVAQDLPRLEFYQERRLRGLGLMDEDGSSTYDPFQEDFA